MLSLSHLPCKALNAPLSAKFYGTYFMKGTDTNTLSLKSQKRLLSFIDSDPLSSSFLIYNSNYTLSKIKTWQKKLPWIKPFYAIKSNPIQPLLTDVVSSELGLDCASKGEIKRGLDLGVNPQDIVYSNSIKEDKDLKFALKKKVNLTTADTLDEIEKIQSISSGKDMRILWRLSIKEDDSEKLATVFSNKFGDDLKSLNEVKEKMKIIKDMGVNLAGIHFHCGSGQHGSSSFSKAVELARSCLSIGRQMGHRMEILDLGGGFPAGELTNKQIEMLKSTENDALGYQVMAEPGRHFSSNSCYLATRILGKRVKNGKTCYHINDSLYHSFNCVLMDGVSFENSTDQFYQIWKNNKAKFDTGKGNVNGEIGSLFGMTCDGYDIVCKNLSVPEMNVGDWLIIGGMGAYTYGPKSSFNGMNALKKIIAWKGEILEMQEDKTRESSLGVVFGAKNKHSLDDKLA